MTIGKVCSCGELIPLPDWYLHQAFHARGDGSTATTTRGRTDVPRQYVMRPVVKEAMRFVDLTSRDEILTWMREYSATYSATQKTISVLTHMGTINCNEGDWMVRGLEGEFYPISDQKFVLTYEEIG